VGAVDTGFGRTHKTVCGFCKAGLTRGSGNVAISANPVSRDLA